jgi:hypothetical protein
MSISWLGEVFGLGKDEMAKSTKTKANDGRVSAFVGRLSAAKTDRTAFETIVSELEGTEGLTSADLVAIAHRYNKGGKKPTSKVAAIAMIKKRFVEIVRTVNKNKVAERARPW